MSKLQLTISEIVTLKADREYYIDLGYSYEQAQERAYDHLHASRREFAL